MKGQYLILLLAGMSAAWPWPSVFGGEHKGIMVARQDSSSASPTQTASGSSSASATGSAASTAGGSASNTATITGSGSASATGSASQSGSGSVKATTAKNSTKTAIDPRLPPGGISMLTPAAIDGMTFLKVGDQITFKWNYTSLSVPPSYIDVIATNTVNKQTYTIAANQTWQSTQAITWDTNQFTQTASVPFVVATYTLMVYDANSNPTAVASAGYLGSFANLQFGVYTKQPYVPLNDFRCATCSGAMSLHEKQALSVLLGTCVITVLSFTWFAAGLGIFV